MAARKATRKAAVKKKATKKKAAKKKATKKKAGKKKSVKRSAIELIGDDLPKSLKAFGRQLRRDLTAIEKQIEVAGKDTRRSLSRVVRDASHQLGTLEARGEREWRSLSRKTKGDVEQVMKRVRKATGV
jgi:hypothetical protein